MTIGVIIGVILAVALFGFILTKLGFAVRTQPQGRWQGRPRRRQPRP